MLNRLKINSEEDLISLSEIWKRLETGNDMTFFQSFDWNLLLFRQWEKSAYNRATSEIVILFNDDIIIPLIRQKIGLNYKWLGRKRGLYFLGTDSYSDYLNFVYSDDIDLKDIISGIRNLFPRDVFYFSRILKGTLADKGLDAETVVSSGVAVGVETNMEAENYSKSLSKSTRQNLRTALNRMEKAGLKYEYEVIMGPLFENLVNDLLKIHLVRVVNKNRDLSGLKKMFSGFIRQKRVSHKERKNNIVRSAMMSIKNSVTVIVRLDNKIVGYLYGVNDSGVIRIMHNCYDENYAFYSPMFRGSYDFICDCCKDSNIKCVDFTRGKEEYKYKLGGKETELHSYELI